MPSTKKAILGEKLGMTQVFDDARRMVPVTVVRAGTNVVTQVRNVETDGYAAVQLAFGEIDPRRVNKPAKGHFDKAGVPPRRHLVEIRTADAADYTPGQELTAEIFEPGTLVDVIGTTKGKGYAGVMKRHGFHGKPASHGVEKVHRSPGSVGACATPARVFRGTRMAGRMGHDRHTTQNLVIHAVDVERGLLLVRGAIPGPVGGLVVVQGASKVALGRGGVVKAVSA
jgi:large subunit ribosomal protein L3